jgi:hypothetical protein
LEILGVDWEKVLTQNSSTHMQTKQERILTSSEFPVTRTELPRRWLRQYVENS